MSASTHREHHRSSARALAPRLTVAALTVTFALGAVLSGVSAASGTSSLRSINISGGYSSALGNQSSRSLYVLSAEKGAKLHCKSGCLTTWPPLLVKTSVKSISLGKGVKGKIGFVTRSKTMKQVTFNSYPVYQYSGDTGAKQSNGEDIVADGGTWTLVHAGASTAGGTPFKQSSGGGGGGGGW
jgi:predicted lipoprotein with Yx(FWY)xxD motif